MAEKKKINIKLLIDKERNKVLFAESDRNFVEILFSSLTMPIATIIMLSNKQSNLGCIDTLYRSVEALDTQFFQTENCKAMLLKPKSEAERRYRSLELIFDAYGDVPEYYYCPTWSCTTQTNCLVSMFENTTCVSGQKMSAIRRVGEFEIDDDKLNGVFLKGIGKYTIYDDLGVRTLSSDTTLSNNLCGFGVKDGTALEERNVSVSIQEMKELLKCSMLSLTPLTDVFLSKNTEVNIKRPKMEPAGYMKSEPQSDTKPVKLNLVIQKSSNKVLYAVAKADFLDLLFSFVTFPIGSVVELLQGYSSIGSIAKLYKSVEKLVAIEPETFAIQPDFLLHPKIAAQHRCKNQLLKIKEQEGTSVVNIPKCSACLREKVGCGGVCKHGRGTVNFHLVNPKFADTVTISGGWFIKESIAFMVTDELAVEPYSQISGISYLNKYDVLFSDLEERSVTIGEKECLSLLKALLTSKSALTNVFMRKEWEA